MEILYSKTILAFLKKVKGIAHRVLAEEMGLKVGHSRFTYREISYPLHFVVFDHPTRLGYFQGNLYEIGINKIFLLESEEKLKEIIRHELAHLITFIENGKGVKPHGREFIEICKRFGWPSRVAYASIPMKEASDHSRIAQKVRKLLALSSSPHPEEAQAATLKAQALLEKYHLELEENDEEETLLVRTLEAKKMNAKLRGIAEILRSFFVYPVFNYGKGSVYLELIGARVDIEVAEYVAHFLDQQFELLWKEAQKENSTLKGSVAKYSFFRGIVEGYKEKNEPRLKGLIRLDHQLTIRAQTIYPHLSSTYSRFFHNEKAASLGKEKGGKLHIRKGLKQTILALYFKSS